jgi:hypothetical protein
LLFALFAHVLLLSFTPESFPLSMLGLLVLIYMTTDNILNDKKIPLSANVILFCYITGVTVSNGLKVLWAQLFQRGRLKTKAGTFLLSGFVCAGLIVFAFLGAHFFGRLLYGNWLVTDGTNYLASFRSVSWMPVFHYFFCEPLLFHHNYDFWNWEVVHFQYNTIFPFLVSGILYTLVTIALIVNLKQKPVLLLLAFFLSDVLINLVLGFGSIYESYIYGLHWLFIIPLLIGWLYYKIENKQIKTGLDVILICIAVFCAVNNFPRLYDLFFPLT